jgi:hypothetical protein
MLVEATLVAAEDCRRDEIDVICPSANLAGLTD